MGLWERFWSAVRCETDTPPPVPQAMASEKTEQEDADPALARPDATAEARAQRAAERLVDDERLRRNLTDQQFGPLLDWALGLVERVATATAGQSDEAARRRIDHVLAQVRETLTEVDRLAGQPGTVGPIRVDMLITEVIRTPDAEAGRRTILRRAADPPDDAVADEGSA